MSRANPRRHSRAGTSRPRRIAGQRGPGDAGQVPEDVEPDEVPADEPGVDEPGVDEPGVDEPVVDEPEADEPEADEPEAEVPPRGERTARILVAAVAVLAVLLVLQGAWFVMHHVRNPEPETAPVAMSDAALEEGVEAAAKAAQVIVARTYQKYDQEVAAAVALMTPSFAEEYQKITDDVRPEFVKSRTRVDTRVVAQGVVRARGTELDALVFLNQYTSKGVAKKPGTTYAPYRAVLTMVHTDDGWLVDDIETR